MASQGVNLSDRDVRLLGLSMLGEWWKIDDDEAQKMSNEPIPRVTDPDAFRALCEALVEAENREHLEQGEVLRAMIDNAAFGECPGCEDRRELRINCTICNGDGFVPDS